MADDSSPNRIKQLQNQLPQALPNEEEADSEGGPFLEKRLLLEKGKERLGEIVKDRLSEPFIPRQRDQADRPGKEVDRDQFKQQQPVRDFLRKVIAEKREKHASILDILKRSMSTEERPIQRQLPDRKAFSMPARAGENPLVAKQGETALSEQRAGPREAEMSHFERLLGSLIARTLALPLLPEGIRALFGKRSAPEWPPFYTNMAARGNSPQWVRVKQSEVTAALFRGVYEEGTGSVWVGDLTVKSAGKKRAETWSFARIPTADPMLSDGKTPGQLLSSQEIVRFGEELRVLQLVSRTGAEKEAEAMAGENEAVSQSLQRLKGGGEGQERMEFSVIASRRSRQDEIKKKEPNTARDAPSDEQRRYFSPIPIFAFWRRSDFSLDRPHWSPIVVYTLSAALIFLLIYSLIRALV